MKRARSAVLIGLFTALAVPVYSQRIKLVPQVQAGQHFVYSVEFHSSHSNKTESHVVSPEIPADVNLDFSGLLQATVVEAGPSGLHLKTYLSQKPANSSPHDSAPNQLHEAAPDELVEVKISADGSVSQIKGSERLSLEQQLAWRVWLSQFAESMTFPKTGITAGQRWQAVEPEESPSPISQLSWVKKSQYVRDENCGEAASAPQKDKTARLAPGKCAVILVQAQLRQQASRDKATPPNFKHSGLMTRGSSTGTNQTILYISRSSGMLVRSTEDAQQAMDATVSLEDGSNYVRYLVHAKSRSIIQLLPE